MNTDALNALRSYFETLYDMNRNIITLCGVSGFDYFGQYMKTINDMVSAIPRLVPYKYNRAEKKYVVSMDGGLLEYETEIPFLKEDYSVWNRGTALPSEPSYTAPQTGTQSHR